VCKSDALFSNYFEDLLLLLEGTAYEGAGSRLAIDGKFGLF